MTKKGLRIAVLGGGMLGVCTALELARRGKRVTLIEGASDLLQGASRWNEGKIHLGFLYAADPSMRTATRLIAGGLGFGVLVERLLGRSVEKFTTTEDDIFLVHRASVVDAEAFNTYATRTAALVRDAASQADAPPYLTDVTEARVRSLSRPELSDITCSDGVVAGFRVPERSISTVAIADLLMQVVLDEPRIEVRTGTWIDGVERRNDGRFEIASEGISGPAHLGEPFDVVVNALWEGRPAVDATLGIRPPAPWSHRFRAAVFGSSSSAAFQSAVVCTGPFGDVKRYADGRLYLSWYEAGLIAEGHEIEPPRRSAALTPARCEKVMHGTLSALSGFFPAIAKLAQYADEMEVHGGWVYALGQGSLADSASTLHRRDKFNMTIDRGYISVDTAKYSLAPWLANRVATIVVQV